MFNVYVYANFNLGLSHRLAALQLRFFKLVQVSTNIKIWGPIK